MALRARDLGIDVPLAEVLDPVAWAETHFWPVLETLRTTADVRQAGRSLLDSLPAAAVAWALRAGLSHVATQIGVDFGIVRYAAAAVSDGLVRGVDFDADAKPLPYNPSARSSHGYQLQLPSAAVSVSRVRWQMFGSTVLDIDADDSSTGTIQITDPAKGAVLLRLPTSSSIAPVVGFWPALYGYSYTVPGAILVDWIGGMRSHGGQLGYVPAALADYVRTWAGIRICNQAGTFSTRGVTNASVSVDGISKSNSFQASAMYGVNSSLEAVYKEELKDLDLKAIRLYMRGFTVSRYGG